MNLKIAVLAGDGIGPEVTAEAVRVLQAVADRHDHTFEFEERFVGGVAINQRGTPFPAATRETCLSSNAVLLDALGAYANLRPVIAYEAISECSPLRPEIARDADILIVRELLGGLYFGKPRGFIAEGSTDS